MAGAAAGTRIATALTAQAVPTTGTSRIPAERVIVTP